MKKTVSKFSTMLILVLTLMLGSVLTVQAADGTMQITDGSAAIGENVTIVVTVEAGGQALGDCEATLSYDTSKLDFVSGTDVTENMVQEQKQSSLLNLNLLHWKKEVQH